MALHRPGDASAFRLLAHVAHVDKVTGQKKPLQRRQRCNVAPINNALVSLLGMRESVRVNGNSWQRRQRTRGHRFDHRRRKRGEAWLLFGRACIASACASTFARGIGLLTALLRSALLLASNAQAPRHLLAGGRLALATRRCRLERGTSDTTMLRSLSGEVGLGSTHAPPGDLNCFGPLVALGFEVQRWQVGATTILRALRSVDSGVLDLLELGLTDVEDSTCFLECGLERLDG
mmetsp:Transcript_1734/g.6836  ORF Transcript_1734/g.6836 Transcript_1734/m.6836 type:complete len:234 (+) Transcript_1734:3011-3712(+)